MEIHQERELVFVIKTFLNYAHVEEDKDIVEKIWRSFIFLMNGRHHFNFNNFSMEIFCFWHFYCYEKLINFFYIHYHKIVFKLKSNYKKKPHVNFLKTAFYNFIR